MLIFVSCLGWFFSLFLGGHGNLGHHMDRHISFVVVGGTGDLAKRKIWPSVAELVHKNELDLSSVHFYAGSRDTATVTRNLLTSYFQCDESDPIRSCDHEYDYRYLLQSISAVSLKTSKDYANLNQQINNQMNEVNGREVLRVFYLAVPPFAYSGIIANIDEFCRPNVSLSGDTKLRIAIEKPFGRDLNSAELLAKDMRRFLNDDEVYLVDHYLHKDGVKQMRDFLAINSDILLPIWSNKYIDYIEIVARESLDVKGRSKYYDTYGVIRDMHQSHLTELLLLTVVASTQGKDREHELKNVMLRKVTHPFLHSTFIGQYQGYQHHLMEDTQTVNISRTPTYASVLLGVQDEKWFGIPFYITSGKAVAKQEGFVRVVFRKSAFSCFNNVPECVENIPEIKFKLTEQQEEFITVRPPISELRTGHSSIIKDVQSDDSQCEVTQVLSMSTSSSSHVHAYTSVITGLIRGDQHLFVPLGNIIQSWKVWTPLLRELESNTRAATPNTNLVIYNTDLVEKLTLRAKGTKLITTYTGDTTHDGFINNEVLQANSIMNTATTDGVETLSIQDHLVHVASRSVMLNKIASDIHATALRSVNTKDVFNLALPGGSSALDLFQILSLDYQDTFPWQSTHIWQTDERCVDTSSPDSNLHQLRLNLLNFVNIPPLNIHPMIPKDDLHHSYCKESSDSNDHLVTYDQQVDHLFQEGSGHGFDFVLLGMGRDGHVGSIFPQNGIESYRSVGKHLAVVKLKDNYPIKVKERVSLVMDTIARSNKIGLLLTGDNKYDIMGLIYNHILHQSTVPPDGVQQDHEHKPVYQLFYNTMAKGLTVYINKNSLCH